MSRFAYEICAPVLALALLLPLPGDAVRAGEVSPPEGAVILTVAGKIDNWNRGPFDPMTDGFHKHHRFNFDRALTFDRDMLAALPQGEVRAHPPILRGPVTFAGPKLEAILAAAGVDGEHAVALIALDGYTVELTHAELAAREWIVAMTGDGKPLGIGQQGLLWLVHEPAEGEKPSDNEFLKWGWAIFYIEVR